MSDVKEDNFVWESMKKGDQKALASLFRRYYGVLYNYGMKFSPNEDLVKDSIQEVFAYIWEKRNKLSEVGSVRSYLLVTIRRNLLKKLKKLRKTENTHNELVNHEDFEVFSPEDFLVIQETENSNLEMLRNALREIPERMREALYLKTYSELSYKEISSIMGVSSQVARNYVYEAYQRLKLIAFKDNPSSK